MKEILIIEDDVSIAEIERDFLEMSGFRVTLETDGKQGMERALSGNFNLVLLDLMLPGQDGYELCKRIRAKTDIPVLIVSARSDDNDKVRGLGLGADDYIAKPFSPNELLARVKAHIAQYERLKAGTGEEKNNTEIITGTMQINHKTHQVFVSGREINLKNKEYELLYFLASNPEILFSKEQLYEKIWGPDVYGDLNTVIVHINRIREKIEKNPSEPQYIVTVWGSGYRFKPC